MKNNVLMQVSGFVILLCLWEGITRFFQVPEYIFPRFSVLLQEFFATPSYFLKGFLTHIARILRRIDFRRAGGLHTGDRV